MKALNKKIALFLFCLVLPGFFAVNAADLSKPASLKLLFEDRTFTLDFINRPQLLDEIPMHVLAVGGQEIPLDFAENLPPELASIPIETRFKYIISKDGLERYFRANVPLVGGDSDAVTLSINDNGWVSISGFPKSGFEVDFDTLERLINQSFDQGLDYVRVPARKTYSPVVADESLIDRGIREVVAMGHSNFAGSSADRIQNIRVATRKYNGLIIKQGEQFSFNSILGSVGPEEGYTEELVIKGDDTEKEYGGGICQVSTTVFRAAFNGGLDIDQRRNHSYAVPYYQPHGLDATIYLGGQDFRFTNDTPGDLLIQATIYGNNMHFVFYGTDDGRQVVTQGPYVSNHRPAPDPIVEETTVLSPGVEQVVSSAHDGFDVSWTRTVYYGDEVEPEERTFNSYYKAWPARIARGSGEVVEVADEDEIAPISELGVVEAPEQFGSTFADFGSTFAE